MLKFVAMTDREHKKYQDGGTTQGNYNFLTGTYTSGTVNPFTGMPNVMSTGVSGAAGLGTLAGGLVDLFGSKERINEQKGFRTDAQNRIKNFYSDAAEGTYDFTADFKVDKGFSDLYNMSRTKTSTDPLLRAQGTGLSALNQAGGRTLLAGLNPLLQNTAQQEVNIGLSDLQREMAGLSQLSQMRQGAADRNKQIELQNQQFARDLALRRLEQDEMAQATAEQNIEALEQGRRDAFGNIASGIVQTGLSFINPFAEKGMKVPNYRQGGSFPDHSGDGKITQKDILMEKGVIPKPGAKAEYGMKYPGGGMMPRAYQMGGGMPAGPNAGVLAQIMGGGKPPVQGPLPGPASHETNPIDMVDKNGEKVGEAMGGEFIINGDQADGMMAEYKDVREKIKSGEKPTEDEWMEFYEAVDSVFSQPQFQDNMA